MSRALYVGLMSGTSLDGVDAVLVDFSGARPRVLASSRVPYDAALRAELAALVAPGENELERAALAANALARIYARAVEALDFAAHGGKAAVRAVGCHGQTVRHRPERGYTIQIGNAALLAELTGITVVADFRSRDVAAGGQGAPLVPAFHAAVFASPTEPRVVLNLGGIANLTWLPAGGAVSGFDTGPGNCLLDAWAERHLGTAHDEGGAWAAAGTAIAPLLARLLAEPYFGRPPPKSTGRELFDLRWLAEKLSGKEEPPDVQATLVELTARSVAQAIAAHCPRVARVIACGGGTKNATLLRRLEALVAPVPLETSDAYGLAPQLVEATAFAWLAREAIEGRAASLPAATGARAPRVLGAVYPGKAG
ncbi:MAG: anhydro-N-acetylmuramic acid kinase [Burkholderiales bacterium]|nr:anhydro-N-acetylmuramic acid kinase [Burkholderiales bacterium]